MNTFLPYPDFAKSAKCLDNKRLGKQRVEAWQIYLALTIPEYGWKHHPAVKMWRGYELTLLQYGLCITTEWQNRGFKDSLRDKFIQEMSRSNLGQYKIPSWLGNKKFHSAMRSNLLRKDYEHYRKFHWKESPNIPYLWPEERKVKYA